MVPTCILLSIIIISPDLQVFKNFSTASLTKIFESVSLLGIGVDTQIKPTLELSDFDDELDKIKFPELTDR